MSDPASPPASPPRILGFAAVVDLVTGLVLAAIGMSKDVMALSLVGMVLLLSGAGMLAFVTWQRNKPTTL